MAFFLFSNGGASPPLAIFLFLECFVDFQYIYHFFWGQTARAGYFGNAPPKGFNWCKICCSNFKLLWYPAGTFRVSLFFHFYLTDILLLLVRYHIKKSSKKTTWHFKNEKKDPRPQKRKWSPLTREVIMLGNMPLYIHQKICANFFFLSDKFSDNSSFVGRVDGLSRRFSRNYLEWLTTIESNEKMFSCRPTRQFP